MRVVPFVTKQGCRAYRGRRTVQAGETCYAVQDERTSMFFAWSYTNETIAEQMTHKLSIANGADLAFNWRRDIQHTVPSSRDAL